MIVTAQPFFNELDLLEIKFRELAGLVDAHIVVEATRTFTGKPKPLHFLENQEWFAEFPVIHVAVDLPEKADSAWDRERIQYAAAWEAVRRLNPHIVFWCDTDECPRVSTLGRFQQMKTHAAKLDMDHLLFYFDRRDRGQRWRSASIVRFDRDIDKNPPRRMVDVPVIEDAGWHFEYFGGQHLLWDKLNATSHADEEGGRTMRAQVSVGELPGLDRCEPYPVNKLPDFVQRHQDRFVKSFAPA